MRTTATAEGEAPAVISPEMALRRERWLGVDHAGRACLWLGMQSADVPWQTQKSAMPALSKIKPVTREALAT